jgi:hypothetical protein
MFSVSHLWYRVLSKLMAPALRAAIVYLTRSHNVRWGFVWASRSGWVFTMPIVVWGMAHDAHFFTGSQLAGQRHRRQWRSVTCNYWECISNLKKYAVDGCKLISMLGTTLHKFQLWTEYTTIAKSQVSNLWTGESIQSDGMCSAILAYTYFQRPHSVMAYASQSSSES